MLVYLPLLLFVVAGLLSFASLAYLLQLWRKRSVDTSQNFFTLADTALATLLMVGFVYLAWVGISKQQEPTITVGVIVESGLVYACVVVFICGVMMIQENWPWRAFGLLQTRWRTCGVAFMCFLAALPLVFFAQELVSFFVGKIPLQPIAKFWLTNDSWHDRVILAFFAVVVAPVCEETIFRGYLYGVLKRHFGVAGAAITVSVIFAAIHLHMPVIAGLFILALIFTLVYEVTKSLTGAIICHALFNALSLIGIILFPESI